MQGVSFEEILEQIVAADKRYHRDAYQFVREALDHTQRAVARSAQGRLRHVTGQELLGGIRDLALEQFGPMAITVLAEWGVRSSRDFGEIVFNLVEHSLLARTERDSREDFADGLDFAEAFQKPFLPKSRQAADARPAQA